MFHSILVLCTGNICRSPLAEALLRHRLGGRVQVSSAGTAALVGVPADPLAIALGQEHGLDLRAHRGRQATPELLADADLILTMAQDHHEWIARTHPQLMGRTHKLLRWRDNGDVVDPYRRPREVFERAWADIAEGVGDWLPRLKARPGRSGGQAV